MTVLELMDALKTSDKWPRWLSEDQKVLREVVSVLFSNYRPGLATIGWRNSEYFAETGAAFTLTEMRQEIAFDVDITPDGDWKVFEG